MQSTNMVLDISHDTNLIDVPNTAVLSVSNISVSKFIYEDLQCKSTTITCSWINDHKAFSNRNYVTWTFLEFCPKLHSYQLFPWSAPLQWLLSDERDVLHCSLHVHGVRPRRV